MRIPNLTMTGALVARLNTLNSKQNQLNEELSSGQRITLASEDPQAANRIMRLRSEQKAVQVYAKNSDRAMSVSQASLAALDHLKVFQTVQTNWVPWPITAPFRQRNVRPTPSS